MTALDLALGIFFGFVLIRLWLHLCGDWQILMSELQRYFDVKDKIKNKAPIDKPD